MYHSRNLNRSRNVIHLCDLRKKYPQILTLTVGQHKQQEQRRNSRTNSWYGGETSLIRSSFFKKRKCITCRNQRYLPKNTRGYPYFFVQNEAFLSFLEPANRFSHIQGLLQNERSLPKKKTRGYPYFFVENEVFSNLFESCKTIPSVKVCVKMRDIC